MNNRELAERIRKYRAENNLSQEKFARLAGVSKTLITHLESRPERMNLQQLSVAKIEHALKL